MRSRIVPIALAVALALVAAVAVLAYVRGTEARVRGQAETATMLVTTGTIPAGLTLQGAVDQQLVEATTVPATSLPRGSVTEVSAANGALLAIADIPPGQVLLAAGFAAELPETGPLDIPDGMAAVSVQLDDPSRVGSFLRPGSTIAVLDTFEEGGGAAAGEPRTRATRVLLPELTVLAVGDATVSADAEGADVSRALITVAVTQPQAERLVHGMRTGTLTLALLDAKADLSSTRGVDDTTLFSD